MQRVENSSARSLQTYLAKSALKPLPETAVQQILFIFIDVPVRTRPYLIMYLFYPSCIPTYQFILVAMSMAKGMVTRASMPSLLSVVPCVHCLMHRIEGASDPVRTFAVLSCADRKSVV